MEDKEEIKRELNELAPRLARIDKKNPFGVPPYYFQGLPDRVLERVKAQPVSWMQKVEAWLNNVFAVIFRPRYAIPASAFVLMVIVVINFLKTGRPSSQFDIAQPLAEISTEEISEFAMENFDEFDWVALTETRENVKGLIPADITSDDLRDYLQNNTDNQTLEEDIL